jgi:hypothetical protein
VKARVPDVLPAAEFAFFLIVLAGTAFGQSALGENCDLRVFSVAERENFLAFDRELREALAKQDAGMMALMVKYPLRVNDERGSYYIHDAASLDGRIQEIFTSAVRDTVLKERSDTVWCNYTGITYGNGVLWINLTGDHYAVQTVNLPTSTPSLRTRRNKLEFVCNADKHRVIVDEEGGNLRYRAWNKPRPLTEKPDIEISRGKKSFEGSGPCAYAFWKFDGGTARFTVEGLGACDPETPSDAVGRLQVSISGKPDVSWWCR